MLKINGKTVAKNVKILKNVFSLGTGLMFRKKLLADSAYYFKLPYTGMWDVHMLFVFQTIDVILVKDNKIVELREGLRPFKTHWPKQKINVLIEMSAGSIRKHSIKVGQTVSLSSKKKDL